ncbi:N-acyl-phosphatidylethanolamine-hydrolyzing phospholipase D [Plasmodium brasilianum]|uniref:Metallo-beta-lactamase domain-containing protein n=2 Tax=Plasmodium (Plasmodium) TaxID=418103 RepID=A0A1A8WD72_PLAMA|nr:N-acyl-phosphatidylethanolamine-hydrolyzing phospholipase D [Plasmodium brasilianum]SBS89698.1 hypothetical protein, conserved [Plasmodium malariae]
MYIIPTGIAIHASEHTNFEELKNCKNVEEKNKIKKYITKRLANHFGFAFHMDVDRTNMCNGSSINKSTVKEIPSNNNGGYVDKKPLTDNEEINAIWPERISYVTPLKVKKKIMDEKFNVIYIGHMSILIQLKNFNILIDPVLSNRIGLYNVLGIKRTIKAGISFEYLPNIDFILLSNNRFDTMDISTLKKIILRDSSIVIGGMNIRRYLTKRNFPVVYPLNWFNKLTFENISFYYLPTLTNSHRYFCLDKNVYLPGSFLIHDTLSNASIFYSGHSAYSCHFLQIKNYVNIILKNGNIDLAILPIGIYKPRSLYDHFHMSPEQAVLSHFDLNSKMSLGIGMDVFCLGGEKYREATTELVNILDIYENEKKKKINFVTLQPGHNITF